MAKLKVDVTWDHIDQGVGEDPYGCPIALAIGDLPNVMGGAFVDSTMCEFTHHDCHVCDVPLPKKARTFVQKFDSGQDVKPFSFTLNL